MQPVPDATSSALRRMMCSTSSHLTLVRSLLIVSALVGADLCECLVTWENLSRTCTLFRTIRHSTDPCRAQHLMASVTKTLWVSSTAAPSCLLQVLRSGSTLGRLIPNRALARRAITFCSANLRYEEMPMCSSAKLNVWLNR